VADEGAVALLEAYGTAFQSAVREVYRRCVLHGEPWFTAKNDANGTSGLRSELIARGWSQREATSIYTTATAAQSAAVESTKLALQRVSQDLEVVQDRLKTAKRRPSEIGKRHGLARRRDRLASRCERLTRRLQEDDVRVFFGGRKLALAGNDPLAHGYESREQWRERFNRARSSNFVLYGDAESPDANYSARIVLSDDRTDDAVVLRVPAFLRHLTDGKATVRIAVRGFANNRGTLSWAMVPDFAGHKERVQSRERQSAVYAAQTAALATGQQTPVPKPPTKTEPALRCNSPVSVRFHFDERLGGWYVQATFNRPARMPKPKPTLVLGADLNPDHIAWSLVKTDGNPMRWGRIDFDLSGTADQNRDGLGVAVAELARIARRHGAVIAVETLDFTRARAQLRYSSRRLKRLLSSFAYNKFFEILSSRCAREDLDVISVNPAWSSVLGQANYAGVRGVSVDQGAAAVLARRALGLGERVRPAVALRLPRSAAAGQTQHLRMLAKALPRRRATWEPRGFCSRVEQSAAESRKPQGKDAPFVAVPAPCSQSGPTRGSLRGKPVPCDDTVAVATVLAAQPYRGGRSTLSAVNVGQGWE
jgi:IS605 OrfB family transposase